MNGNANYGFVRSQISSTQCYFLETGAKNTTPWEKLIRNDGSGR